MARQDYFKNLLVPVDGSTSCLRAKQLAASIAAKFQSKVTVVHVISHDFMHPELKAHHQLPALVLHELDSVYLKAGKKILRHAEELFLDEGIAVKTELIKAEDPGETILEMAEDQGFDLIVIGNRAKTQHERFALGSVTEKVSMYAPCPVLITKRKKEIRRLLAAIDGSQQANKALDHAVAIAKNFGAKITLLHVEEAKLFSLKPEIVKKVGEEILQCAESRLQGVSFDKSMKPGSPVEIILKMAWLGDFDLIVMGSRGLSSVKRFLLGSVSADVSMHARTSVLLVK
jgi:nucleotide-binding universal stress UspA family protein